MQVVYIPDDLIGIKAYHLWKDAGEPDGADFSGDARQALDKELKAGKTLQVMQHCQCFKVYNV
jgi:alpha-glucan, water dikinase